MTPMIFAVILALSPGSMKAQGCCTGGVPLTGTYSVTSLENSQWILSLTYDNHAMNDLFIGSEKLSDPTVQRRSQSILLQAGYGFNDRINVSLLVSHIWQVEETTDGQNAFRSSGIGDAQLSAQYTIVATPAVQWVGGAGIILPLADTQQSQDQFVLPPSLQPGIGALSGMMYTNIAYSPGFRPQLVFSNALFYRFHGTSDRFANVESYRFGSIFQWFLGATDQFIAGTTVHYPGVSLQYKYQPHDQLNGEKNDNTGGDWLLLMPSYRIAWTPSINSFIQAEIPLFREVNGFQITTSNRITVGVTISPKTKKVP
jgi:hypothetical protein